MRCVEFDFAAVFVLYPKRNRAGCSLGLSRCDAQMKLDAVGFHLFADDGGQIRILARQ